MHAKHMSAEVTAAKAKKAELMCRIKELDRQKKLALAKMELDEEEEDVEEEHTAIWDLDNLVDDKKPLIELEEDEQEDFLIDEYKPLMPQDDDHSSPDSLDDY
jgi:hypothetical protein